MVQVGQAVDLRENDIWWKGVAWGHTEKQLKVYLPGAGVPAEDAQEVRCMVHTGGQGERREGRGRCAGDWLQATPMVRTSSCCMQAKQQCVISAADGNTGGRRGGGGKVLLDANLLVHLVGGGVNHWLSVGIGLKRVMKSA